MTCNFLGVCVIFQYKVLKREMLWLKSWEGQGEEGREAIRSSAFTLHTVLVGSPRELKVP